jgi:site-specific recombinase XerD
VVATKQEGLAWLVDERRRLAQATAPSMALMFSVACSEYIGSCETRHRANTIREKKRHLQDLAKWIGQDFEMGALTRKQCNKFLYSIQKEMGNKAANRGVKRIVCPKKK